METKQWKKFEKLVQHIQKGLSPNARVEHNIRVFDKVTKQKRQVDVAVFDRVGQYEIFIAIECKDEASPVDTPEVESFVTKVKNISANTGVMVAANGFTKGAKLLAEQNNITLYSVVDADNHKWQKIPMIPTTIRFVYLKSSSFGFLSTAPNFELIPDKDSGFFGLPVYNQSGGSLGTIRQLSNRSWDNGLLPTEVGSHTNIVLCDEYIKNSKGDLVPVSIKINPTIAEEIYFGYLPITKIKGFNNEIKGGVVAQGFQTAPLGEMEKNWKQIDSIDHLPDGVTVMFHIEGQYSFGE